jgi:hypothetical protein
MCGGVSICRVMSVFVLGCPCVYKVCPYFVGGVMVCVWLSWSVSGCHGVCEVSWSVSGCRGVCLGVCHGVCWHMSLMWTGAHRGAFAGILPHVWFKSAFGVSVQGAAGELAVPWSSKCEAWSPSSSGGSLDLLYSGWM